MINSTETYQRRSPTLHWWRRRSIDLRASKIPAETNSRSTRRQQRCSQAVNFFQKKSIAKQEKYHKPDTQIQWMAAQKEAKSKRKEHKIKKELKKYLLLDGRLLLLVPSPFCFPIWNPRKAIALENDARDRPRRRLERERERERENGW